VFHCCYFQARKTFETEDDEATCLGPNLTSERTWDELDQVFKNNKGLKNVLKRWRKKRRTDDLKPLPAGFQLTPDTIGDHADRWGLKDDQRLAHHIAAERLLVECGHADFKSRVLGNPISDPVRMCVLRAGGSGKSRVIASIRELFQIIGHPEWLAITAITGTAASLVSGQTFDSLTGANRQKAKIGADILIDDHEVTINVSGERFKLVRFVICDEFSMIGHYHLNLLDEALKKSRGAVLQKSFAGVNVFFFGDPFQFPPIGDRALFKTTDSPAIKMRPTNKELGNMRGYTLWHKRLTHVIRLRRQYRVEVQAYADFLVRLRYGKCTEEDVEMLNTRVLPSDSNLIQALQDADLPLITSRNSVRTNVSFRYLRNWTLAQKQPLVVSVAQDKVAGVYYGHSSSFAAVDQEWHRQIAWVCASRPQCAIRAEAESWCSI